MGMGMGMDQQFKRENGKSLEEEEVENYYTSLPWELSGRRSVWGGWRGSVERWGSDLSRWSPTLTALWLTRPPFAFRIKFMFLSLVRHFEPFVILFILMILDIFDIGFLFNFTYQKKKKKGIYDYLCLHILCYWGLIYEIPVFYGLDF